MTDDNRTHGYYIVKWDRPPYELQEDTEIFQAGDVVCNATYLDTIQQPHHWYTQTTINTVVRVQNFLLANIELQKPSSPIKLPKTCNCRETAQKGAINLPDCSHKGIMDEIILRDELEFIHHKRDVHQDEEEY